MSRPDTVPWQSLERWRAGAFLGAAGLFAVFAMLWGADVFTDIAPRPAVDVFGPGGWMLAFVGLLGLYPRLPGRTTWLNRAAAVFTTVGLGGATVTAVVNLGQLTGLWGQPPAWFAVLNLLMLVGIVPGFLTFAIAVRWTDVQSQSLGLLLLVPALLFAVNVVRVTTLGPRAPTGAPFVLGSGQALAFLAIGVVLRTAETSTDRATSTADAPP
ncbi:hypothetical protein [Salinirubrum litoreum]|uniref:Uncharacterized protein n=1 Tax=Salinirubrum litoreum TaxID=1126234 RepID=A0ABD5RCW2_9EURY|nr:hypothetical protein [Salinirubrum litoreum]